MVDGYWRWLVGLMVHVFLLIFTLSADTVITESSDDMYFWSIDRCNYFAYRLTNPKVDATAYCTIRQISRDEIASGKYQVYD